MQSFLNGSRVGKNVFSYTSTLLILFKFTYFMLSKKMKKTFNHSERTLTVSAWWFV